MKHFAHIVSKQDLTRLLTIKTLVSCDTFFWGSEGNEDRSSLSMSIFAVFLRDTRHRKGHIMSSKRTLL